MLYLFVVMLVILAVAGVVVLYAAYPHRGERLPALPWLGDAMSRAADSVPTVEPETSEERPSAFHR